MAVASAGGVAVAVVAAGVLVVVALSAAMKFDVEDMSNAQGGFTVIGFCGDFADDLDFDARGEVLGDFFPVPQGALDKNGLFDVLAVFEDAAVFGDGEIDGDAVFACFPDFGVLGQIACCM